MPKEGAKSRRDAAIASLAAAQHGVISAQQLYGLGLPATTIRHRVTSSRLHRIHRGVYAVGHSRLSNEGRWMAAVLACRPGAVLSYRSAAELWGIHDRARRPSTGGGPGEQDPIDVTVPGIAGRKTRTAITLHRSSTLIASECTRRDGIPVTKPARTLADLRPVLSDAEFAAVVREAEFLRLPIGDRPGSRSGGVDRRAPERTRTELESKFLALVRRHRLPRPEVNVRIDRFEVDFLWRPQRLIVEVDGWESHGTRSAFEEDRARDARLKMLGYGVVRFTWRQVTSEGAGVARALRALLASQ
jgi:very-short-patch-repair endonuclease